MTKSAAPPRKIWDMETTDVMRFVISRAQWNTLLKALATGASRATDNTFWDGLEVLKHCEEDVDASRMVIALTKIAEWTKEKKTHHDQLINSLANSGLNAEAAHDR